MAKVHVKKGDTVVVLHGESRNKKGKVLSVNPDSSMVLVEGVNMSTKHKKPKNRYQQGGIVKQEAPVHSSNVMHVCNKCGKPSRTGKQILENGTKIRVCKGCGGEIDTVIEKK